MHPCESLRHVLLRLEALHQLDDLQVRHIDQRMLCHIIILLREKNALLEQILADLMTVLLRDDL